MVIYFNIPKIIITPRDLGLFDVKAQVCACVHAYVCVSDVPVLRGGCQTPGSNRVIG